VDLSRDDWYASANWAFAAEASLGVGDAELGRAAYDLLVPLAGGVAVAGSTLALGPVDAFLALAAAASGRHDEAVRHAEAAEALMDTWAIPACGAWFRELRARHDF
jgi:hypothetical protein